MKRRPFLLALVLAASSVAASPRIDDLFLLRSLGDVQLDPEGRRAVIVVGSSSLESNERETNLWSVDLDSARGAPLTSSGKDEHPRWSPDGERVAFLSRREDDRGIWLVPADGGEPTELVRESADIETFAWLPDGSGLLFTMREPPSAEEGGRRVGSDRRLARLYRWSAPSGEAEPLTPADVHVDGFDVARGSDGRFRVAYTSQPSPEVRDGRLHSDLVLLDLESRESHPLVTQPGLDHSPRFSPDGMEIAFVSMGGRADWLGNYYVMSVRVDGTALHNVTEGFDERVEYHLDSGEAAFRWSSDGRRIYFLGLRGIHQRLWVTDVRGGTIAPASAGDEKGVASSFDLARDGTVVAVRSGPESPPELYELTPDGSTTRLTDVNSEFPLEDRGSTEQFAYEAEDGLDLQALLVKPPDFESGRRYPLLVVVHGGPMGVFDAGFAPRRGVYPVDALARSGFLVLLPNPRGSGGFGESFRKAAVSQWGLADFEDVLRGVDVLVERGLADPDRLGIMGWSYGGYMTAWAITQTDRFRAASIGAAITNTYSFWGTTDIPEFIEAYFGGRPWEEPTSYLRHAPMQHVERVSTPSLLQHGEADRRVPLAQGLSFHRALESRGVPVEMFTYPGEGHSIQKPVHLKHALERNLAWFERWLGDRQENADEK